MKWFVGVLVLTCAVTLKGANGQSPGEKILDGFAKRLEVMTETMNSGPYYQYDTQTKEYAAQVFDDAFNVTYTYKQFFILGDAWRPTMSNETWRDLRLNITRGMKRFFEDAAAVANAEAKPFGGRECGLLPAELRRFTAENYTIAPRLSVMLYALAHELGVIAKKLQNNQEFTGGDVHRGIMDVCGTVGVDRVADFFKPAKTLVGPECENGAAEEGSVEKAMMEAMMSYTRSHDFPAIKDNGCLQIFVARHTHLSAQAMHLLLHSVSAYMYITMNMQAFCTPFVPLSDPNEPENESARILDALGNGRRFLHEKLKLNETASWSCEEHTTTKAPTVDSSKAPSVAPSNSTGSLKSTTVAAMTMPPIPDGRRDMWRNEAEGVAKRVISAASKSINANTWEKRCKELHPAVTKALDSNLKNLTAKFSQENTKFYSVAMLTYNDNGKSCMIHNDYSIYGTHEHVTYLAQPFSGSEDSLNATKTALKAREQDIIDKTFSFPSDDLCKTASVALKDVLGLSVEETVYAYVVVSCGYKFVWYELGYEYFPAANSTSPYALTTRQNNVYSANCGQIILFP